MARVSGLLRKLAARSRYEQPLRNLIIFGPQFFGHLHWVHRSQWYPATRIRHAQERRLGSLVAQAYLRCPHYRERFRAHGVRPADVHTLEDLQRLPVLSRQAVESNFETLVATDAKRYRPVRGSTGGTSGVRLDFLTDRSTRSIASAIAWRFRAWHGIRFDHRIARIFPFRSPSGEPDTTTVVRGVPGSRIIWLNMLGADAERRQKVADVLGRFQPHLIHVGSPTWLNYLGLYLLEHPEYRIRPKAVFSCGERLFPGQRNLISEAFDAPVIDYYTTNESVMFAAECERGRMHVASELGIVEILKRDRRCQPGEEGDVVITNLWNRAMPFIRYAIGDLGMIEPGSCACGRRLPTWKIVGRHGDLLATATGHVLATEYLVATPQWRGKIAGIKYYQEARGEVVALVVKGPTFTDADVSALQEELTQRFQGQLRVFIQFCETLEQTPGGKYRIAVSKVPIEA